MYSYNLGLRFNEIVEAFPDHIALIFPRQGFASYRELNVLANRIAHYMMQRGVKTGDVICISGEKNLHTFAAMIAALKIGAIYCVLDHESPAERLHKIVSTCNPRMIIAGEALLQELNTFDLGTRVFSIPVDSREFEALLKMQHVENPEKTIEITAAQPAYIMYTSSTTGIPKGAVITHGSILNLIEWSKLAFGNGPGEILTNLNPLYFDNSVFDIYSAFFTGAALVPFTPDQIRNPELLLEILGQTRCTQWFSVPSTLVYLQSLQVLDQDSFKSLKRVIFGGEGYPLAQLKRLFDLYKSRIDFHNVYGPTECTCIASSYLICEDDFQDLNGFPALGSMIENFDFLILDEHNQPVPQDTMGELCLMGPNVGLGYYNDPALTRQNFIQNPINPNFSQILYKTGDLVKHASKDDKIYICGRLDNQIKHMGYRIELEEIEKALNQIDNISQAVVVHGQFRGLSKMIAAICTTSPVDDMKLRAELAKIIPRYMIPGTFYTMNDLPRTANGKVDRKKITAMYFDED